MVAIKSHNENTNVTTSVITLSVIYMWLGSLVVRVLDLQVDGREFDSLPLRLILGWVIVVGQANHLSISPSHSDQLSLLPSVGWHF